MIANAKLRNLPDFQMHILARSVRRDGAGDACLRMQLRRALARQPDNASWDRNPSARQQTRAVASFVYRRIYNATTFFWLRLQ